MSKKYDPDVLVELSDSEIETRIKDAADRIETRVERCQNEGRDLTSRESSLMVEDRAELSALRDAERMKSETAAKLSAISNAIAERSAPEIRDQSARSLLVSHRHLAQAAQALADGRPYGAVEERARVTAAGELGSAGGWHPGLPNEPRHLILFAGIPVSELTGRTAQVPVYNGPGAASGVDEDTSHPEYDDMDPANLTALRYGRWTAVSSLANVVDDLIGINRMHAWGIARDLDAVAVNAVEAAAGAPPVMGDDLELELRQAVLTVAANSYSDESALVVVGTPVDIARVTGTTPTNGDDVGTVSVRFSGARLYPTAAASAGQLTVFAPASFRVFQSHLQSAAVIDPASGEHKFGQWLHSTGLAEQITGSAVAIETADLGS